MRNPVRNIEHEISRINTELEEIYLTLGEKFYNSPEKEAPPSARISRAVKLIDGKPFLLLATLAIYSLFFYRVGCTEH